MGSVTPCCAGAFNTKGLCHTVSCVNHPFYKFFEEWKRKQLAAKAAQEGTI